MGGGRTPRVHLSIKKSGDVACGATPKPRRQTRDVPKVTCANCRRTIHMAMAEIASRKAHSRGFIR